MLEITVDEATTAMGRDAQYKSKYARRPWMHVLFRLDPSAADRHVQSESSVSLLESNHHRRSPTEDSSFIYSDKDSSSKSTRALLHCPASLSHKRIFLLLIGLLSVTAIIKMHGFLLPTIAG